MGLGGGRDLPSMEAFKMLPRNRTVSFKMAQGHFWRSLLPF